jgi:hypothetical protein
MDPKPHLNHARYLEALRGMTPEQRLLKAFELTEQSQELLRAGIRWRFPDATPEQQQSIYLEQLERCRSRPS